MNKIQKFGAVLATSAVSASAFAVGPSAGDLTNLVPDSASILTAIGSVAVVLLGITLAIVGFKIVRGLMRGRG